VRRAGALGVKGSRGFQKKEMRFGFGPTFFLLSRKKKREKTPSSLSFRFPSREAPVPRFPSFCPQAPGRVVDRTPEVEEGGKGARKGDGDETSFRFRFFDFFFREAPPPTQQATGGSLLLDLSFSTSASPCFLAFLLRSPSPSLLLSLSLFLPLTRIRNSKSKFQNPTKILRYKQKKPLSAAPRCRSSRTTE